MAYSYLFKLILIGNVGSGKSSLLAKYKNPTIVIDEIQPTLGVDFEPKEILLNSIKSLNPLTNLGNNSKIKVKLQIWDTTGQETYKSLIKGYYRKATGVIIVYDVTKRDSFLKVEQCYKETLDNLGYYEENGFPCILLVANKIDKDDRKVTETEGKNLAEKYGMIYLETSAKTCYNVPEVFTLLGQKILDTVEALPDSLYKADIEEIYGIKRGSYHIQRISNTIELTQKKSECKSCCSN